MNDNIVLNKPVPYSKMIEEVSKIYHINIGKDVSDFLKKYSRGRFSHKKIELMDEIIWIAGVISVDEKDMYNMKYVSCRLNTNPFGEKRIPVFYDGYGNFICLKYNSTNTYQIVFLNEEQNQECLICDKFEELLKLINV